MWSYYHASYDIGNHHGLFSLCETNAMSVAAIIIIAKSGQSVQKPEEI
ncbi:MAG: hypothetical protein ACJ71R_21095 [Nitrososphaeraceae archaeon]